MITYHKKAIPIVISDKLSQFKTSLEVTKYDFMGFIPGRA